MLVKDTVFQMMRQHPWSFPTRAEALLWLFDAYDTKWQDGELVRSTEYEENESYLPFGASEVADPVDDDKISQVIAARKNNGEVQFIHENAYLLCRDTSSSFRPGKPLSFKGQRFADLPDNVTVDWMKAAQELAWAVKFHKHFPERDYASVELERQQTMHAEAVKVCDQFLERFLVVTPSPFERAARVRELQREAQALGLHLTEADGAPPKTAAF